MATGACLAPTTASSSTLTGTADPNPLLAALARLTTAISGLSFLGWRRKPVAAQLAPALAAHLAAASERKKRRRIKVSPAWRRLGGGKLSPRECEVALLLSRGLSNNEIALELGIGCGTVKVHVHAILAKLGAKNRHDELIRPSADRAHSSDIIDPRGVLPPNDASDNTAAGYRVTDGKRPGLAWAEDARALAAI